MSSPEPDLVVFSHLRWVWVWQRPQQLITRLARARAESGARTWFVEEPLPAPVSRPRLHVDEHGDVARVVLLVPQTGQQEHLSYDAVVAQGYAQELLALFEQEDRPRRPDAWLYTPMALPVAHRVHPGRVVYDVMDDLAAFTDPPQGLRRLHHLALRDADLVFTGGLSLHRAARAHRPRACHLFPSGVDARHFERASQRPLRRARRTAGYVGVVDERLDRPLLRDLAEALPDWTIRLVGPVTKIPEASLPRARNVEYIGLTPYEQLPEVLAGFDVALMPFALGAATRSISPTKTLEYLAAGLPVVSTPVPDVVAELSGVVHFAEDAAGFAVACRRALDESSAERQRQVAPLLARREWDGIAAAMGKLVQDLERRGPRTDDMTGAVEA